MDDNSTSRSWKRTRRGGRRRTRRAPATETTSQTPSLPRVLSGHSLLSGAGDDGFLAGDRPPAYLFGQSTNGDDPDAPCWSPVTDSDDDTYSVCSRLTVSTTTTSSSASSSPSQKWWRAAGPPPALDLDAGWRSAFDGASPLPSWRSLDLGSDVAAFQASVEADLNALVAIAEAAVEEKVAPPAAVVVVTDDEDDEDSAAAEAAAEALMEAMGAAAAAASTLAPDMDSSRARRRAQHNKRELRNKQKQQNRLARAAAKAHALAAQETSFEAALAEHGALVASA